MGRFQYAFKRMLRMDYAAFFKTLTVLRRETGRTRLSLLCDIQRCATRYGAGYTDYALFEMYKLSDAKRDTYITRGRNNELMKRYNASEDALVFDDKRQFDTRFAAYLNREFVCSDAPKADVSAFLRRHETVVLKPALGMCGKGVEILDVAACGGAEAAYTYIQQAQIPMVIEEVLSQHETVSAVYPHAINTARIVTILKDDTVHVICAYWRIGNNGARVDNFNSGGMVAPVDEASGIVRDHAVDKQKRVYARHPYTDAPIKGFALPFWEEALTLVTAAAKEVPTMRYIGWDVAFTINGACLVEGNNFPGHDIYQLPAHTPDGIGMWAKFQV